MRSLLWPFALAGALTLAHTSAAHAQRWGGPVIDQVLSPGDKGWWYTEPYTQRYSYGYSALYINGNSRQLRYADYLDKLDRALKFGYPIPRDPYFTRPPKQMPDGTVVIDPADPNTDPADIIPSPPVQPRTAGRGLFFRRN